jgi:lysyl-tRNA synthetase class II
MNELYDEHVEATLDGPVFVIDHPREVSPLAKPHRSDPARRRIERKIRVATHDQNKTT